MYYILMFTFIIMYVTCSIFQDTLLDIEKDIIEQFNGDNKYDDNCEYMACVSGFDYYYCDLDNKTSDCNIAYLLPDDSTILLDNYYNDNSMLRKIKLDFDKYMDIDEMEFILIGDINFVRIYPGRHPYDCKNKYEILHREWYIRSFIEPPRNNIISSEIANKNCIEWINNTIIDSICGKYTLYYNIKKNKQCNINDLRESYGNYIFQNANSKNIYKSQYIQYWTNKQWGYIYNKHIVIDGNYYGTIAIGSIINDTFMNNITYLSADTTNITISNDTTGIIYDNFTYYYNICNICNQSKCCNQSKIPEIPDLPNNNLLPGDTSISTEMIILIVILLTTCFIIYTFYYICINMCIICTQFSTWPPILIIGAYISDNYIKKYNEKRRKKEMDNRFEMMCYIGE